MITVCVRYLLLLLGDCGFATFASLESRKVSSVHSENELNACDNLPLKNVSNDAKEKSDFSLRDGDVNIFNVLKVTQVSILFCTLNKSSKIQARFHLNRKNQ